MMARRPGTAFILAAGFGTRMGKLTERTPKPLLAVSGRTLLDRAIDRVLEAGVNRIVVNVHAHAEQIRAHLARRAGIPISISIEREILETGGGARKALSLMAGESILSLNADAIWTGTNPLGPLLEAWAQCGDRLDAMLLLHPRSRCIAHAGRGDFHLAPDGTICRAQENSGALVYTGAQCVRRNALEEAPRGAWSFNLLWDRLIVADRIRGVAGDNSTWIDVGTPEGLASARHTEIPDRTGLPVQDCPGKAGRTGAPLARYDCAARSR